MSHWDGNQYNKKEVTRKNLTIRILPEIRERAEARVDKIKETDKAMTLSKFVERCIAKHV